MSIIGKRLLGWGSLGGLAVGRQEGECMGALAGHDLIVGTKAAHVPGRSSPIADRSVQMNLSVVVPVARAAARDVPRSDWSAYPFLITPFERMLTLVGLKVGLALRYTADQKHVTRTPFASMSKIRSLNFLLHKVSM